MKKLFSIVLCSSFMLIAQHEGQEIAVRTVPITKETITLYLTDFPSFIDTKRHEKNQLSHLPDSNSFFGKAANFFIENLIAPLFSKYGNANIEEAKIFLNRTFEREDLLKKAIDMMPDNEATIAYLDEIFSQAEGDILTKKDGPRFLEIVKKVKYGKIRDPKSMGDKDPYGHYILPNSAFYNFSAATLMAFHIFENHVTMAPSLKRHRKSHMQHAT